MDSCILLLPFTYLFLYPLLTFLYIKILSEFILSECYTFCMIVIFLHGIKIGI